jgi:hypothetical protein
VKPFQHVRHGSLGGGATFALAFGVVEVKEVCRWLWSIVAPVTADVESLCRDGEPLKIALC